MKKPLQLLLAGAGLALSIAGAAAQSSSPPPGTDPNADPTGTTGALKEKVTTGGSYSAHSGNASRSVTDLRVPGALSSYGLDFTRHWNSTDASFNPGAETVGCHSFASGGWTHSWNWVASYHWEDDFSEADSDPIYGGMTTVHHIVTIKKGDGSTARHVYSVNDGRGGLPYEQLYNPPSYPAMWSGPGLKDHLREMAPDRSSFWLYLADGGAVYFEWDANQYVYLGTRIIDPRGFETRLSYQSGRLTSVVEQMGGRSLQIGWNAVGIAAVQSASERVEYGYTSYATEGYQWEGLSGVFYGGAFGGEWVEGQPVRATYTYTPWVARDPEYPSLIRGLGPLLTRRTIHASKGQ